MSKKPIIEHDRYERRGRHVDPWLWWGVLVMLAFLWIWYFTFQAPHWVSVAIGFATGMMVMAWAGDTWGDRPYSETTKIFPDDDRQS